MLDCSQSFTSDPAKKYCYSQPETYHYENSDMRRPRGKIVDGNFISVYTAGKKCKQRKTQFR